MGLLLLTQVHHRILRRGQLSPPAPDAPRQSRQPMQHQEELYQKLEVCTGIARFRLQNSKQTKLWSQEALVFPTSCWRRSLVAYFQLHREAFGTN